MIIDKWWLKQVDLYNCISEININFGKNICMF